MLSFVDPTVYERSNCFFTYGRLGHLEPHQLPTSWKSKGKPWSTVLSQDSICRVDLILSQNSWSLIRDGLLASTPAPEFCRVTMALSQVLEGDFFTEYIKIGDIIMLSRGRNDMDNVFSLKDGQLTMFLDKETYERAGLVGRPFGAKGNRGRKPRWVVEFDLRSPSMFKGKKGFDRLVYACKNILNEPVTWLFCNVSPKVPNPDPLDTFHPTRFMASPDIVEELDVTLPSLKPPTSDLISEGETQDLPDSMNEIYEWLSLVRLQSPRVLSNDSVDSFLSRYQPPGDSSEHTPTELCTITWEGFLSPTFVHKMLVDVILKLPSRDWFSLVVSSFSKGFSGDAAECTFLRPPNTPGEYMLWEIRSHE